MPAIAEPIFRPLDAHSGRIPLQDILNWLRQNPISVHDVADAVIFNPDRYVRNLLHAGPAYQALILCWRNGQRSPIHNHRGSHCGVRVLQGVATETTFAHAPNGMIVPIRTREMPEGTLCASADADMHQVSNLQAGGADLVTLHIYSPPLLTMDVYSLDNPLVRSWEDPVNVRFAHGGGI